MLPDIRGGIRGHRRRHLGNRKEEPPQGHFRRAQRVRGGWGGPELEHYTIRPPAGPALTGAPSLRLFAGTRGPLRTARTTRSVSVS